MTDSFARSATPIVPSSRSEDEDASLQCLRSLLRGGSVAAAEEPAEIACRLTLQSQAFIRGFASAFGGSTAGVETAPLDPSAHTMLGWQEEHVDTGDEFADRLIAAFQSGALDIKPGFDLDYSAPAPVAAQRSRVERQRPPLRGPGAPRPERQHQKYAAPGMVGRPLYTPW